MTRNPVVNLLFLIFISRIFFSHCLTIPPFKGKWTIKKVTRALHMSNKTVFLDQMKCFLNNYTSENVTLSYDLKLKRQLNHILVCAILNHLQIYVTRG